MLHIHDSHLTEEVSRIRQPGPLAILGDVLGWLPIGGKQREVVKSKKNNEGVILFGFIPGSAKAIGAAHRIEGGSLTPQVAQSRQVLRSHNSSISPQNANLKHEAAIPSGKQLVRLQHEGAMPGNRRGPHAGVSKEELGRATWTFLHTLAAQYPEKPTRSQQKDVKAMVMIPLLE
jgi:CHASE2 domain-containing sensor protein